MSYWLELGAGALGDGLWLCLKVICIVTPLFFLYELAKQKGLFEKPWPRVGAVLSRLGLSQGSAVPLLVGLFLGIIYGAGILISMSRENQLDLNERLALAMFLVTCHSVIEDVAIFVLIGGDAFWMLAPRVVLAVALCMLLVRWGRRRRFDQGPDAGYSS